MRAHISKGDLISDKEAHTMPIDARSFLGDQPPFELAAVI